MNPKDIRFSVNDYDQDGDIAQRGVFLHFGDTRVMAAETIDEFATIVECMQQILDEIRGNA